MSTGLTGIDFQRLLIFPCPAKTRMECCNEYYTNVTDWLSRVYRFIMDILFSTWNRCIPYWYWHIEVLCFSLQTLLWNEHVVQLYHRRLLRGQLVINDWYSGSWGQISKKLKIVIGVLGVLVRFTLSLSECWGLCVRV